MAKFKPGTSGNPQGKKPGTVSKTTKLRQSLERDIPDILAALVTQAKAGDTTAARLVLERTLPPIRPQDQPVSLPVNGEDLAKDGRTVLAAVGSGEVTPDVATRLMQGLASLARVIETGELLARIERLEASHESSKQG